MTLDDDRRADLERERDRERHDDHADAGSEEAEEAMFREAMTRMHRDQPWRFTDPDPQVSVDARCFPSAGTDEVECWRHPQEPPEGDAA